MTLKHLLAILTLSAIAFIAACGGGGDAGSGTGAIGTSGGALTVSGATGALATNNGSKTISDVTSTTSVTVGGTVTNVRGSLGTVNESISVTFDAATGTVTEVRISVGSSTPPANNISASCSPCTGVSVNVGAKTITFANTPVTFSVLGASTSVNLTGSLNF